MNFHLPFIQSPIQSKPDIKCLFNQEVIDINENGAYIKDSIMGKSNIHQADIIILCTGYKHKVPNFLQPIIDKIDLDDDIPKLNKNFSVSWEHEKDNKIFMQNAGLYTHGISDPNLSIVPWRCATIINELLGENYYNVIDNSILAN